MADAPTKDLDPVSSNRYKEKTNSIGFDPYIIKEWTKESSKFPPIAYGDIFNYLVLEKSAYTSESFKAYKSLGAYNQAYNGWVWDVAVSTRPNTSNTAVVAGKVNHSQALSSKALSPWVHVGADGTVLCAHCDCMAGLGESCSHVAALLFYVEGCHRLAEQVTVTGKPSYWSAPSTKSGVEMSRTKDINFTTAASQRKLVTNSAIKATRPKQSPKIASSDDQNKFLEMIAKAKTKPACLSVRHKFQNSFIPSSDLPSPLTDLHRSDLVGSDLCAIQEVCSQISISVSEQQAHDVERKTVGQSKTKLWHDMREGRITASNFHAVCHTDPLNPSLSLLNQIVRPTSFTSVATSWGLEKEDEARQSYLKIVQSDHFGFNYMPSGLHLCPQKPCFAATPDGLIKCDCCGSGCLEIKCPFTARHICNLKTASMAKDFCLEIFENTLMLKKTHKFFFQIQLQMYVTKTEFCDFFVWTPNDSFLERIQFDLDFISPYISIGEIFFNKVILPEIVSSYYTKKGYLSAGSSNNTASPEIYCTCKAIAHGLMVKCDNDGCNIGWFHFNCVGISRKPRGKWFCSSCKVTSKGKKRKIAEAL